MENEKTTPQNINEYIAGFPKDIQFILNQVRNGIKKAAPEAEEGISYSIPAFKMYARYLVYFAAFKNHVGFYPAPAGIKTFEKELANYKSGKGSVQFPLDKPMPLHLITMPLHLITKIVKYRVNENLKKAAVKNIRSKK